MKYHYNDPERIEKSFIINPNYKGYPERMYRTGDYGRIRVHTGVRHHEISIKKIKQT